MVTVSSTSNFPSELRQKRETTQQFQYPAPIDTWATAEETCRKCGAKEVRYTALQLRSADEGTTLFYYCPECSERYGVSFMRPFSTKIATDRVIGGTKATKQQSHEYITRHSPIPKATLWKCVRLYWAVVVYGRLAIET